MCKKNILICPKCKKSSAPVSSEGNCKYKVFYFTCPKCQSNVVFYNNRLDIISDKVLNEVLQKSGAYGSVDIEKSNHSTITVDDVLDLKDILESANSVESFIKKI